MFNFMLNLYILTFGYFFKTQKGMNVAFCTLCLFVCVFGGLKKSTG